jgi:hypothetical protein
MAFMRPSKHNVQSESTGCLLRPTSGKQDNQQMIDAVPFSARLDAALAMNRMDNATFATFFGPTGQQKVNGWRRRGRIGQPSVAQVRDVLPRTNIDWLQEGIGDPERLTGGAESSRTYDVRQSYEARLDLHTLAKAVRVMTADEDANSRYSPLMHATRLLEYYDRLAQGDSESDLIALVLTQQEKQGATHEKGSTTAR